jgi:hypothetical protein
MQYLFATREPQETGMMPIRCKIARLRNSRRCGTTSSFETDFCNAGRPVLRAFAFKTYPLWDGTGDHELPSWAIVVYAQQYM